MREIPRGFARRLLEIFPWSKTCRVRILRGYITGRPVTMGDVVSSHLDEDRREMITGKMSTVARYNNLITEF